MTNRKKQLTVAAGVVVVAGFGFSLVSIAVAGPGNGPAVSWAIFPVVLVALGYLLVQYVFPAAIRRPGDQGPEPSPAGTVLASARACSGRIGWVRFGNTLGVSVHADRFVLRPVFMRDHTIMASEITALSGTWTKLTVEHAAASTRSPVILWLGRHHEVRLAIESLPVSRPRPTG